MTINNIAEMSNDWEEMQDKMRIFVIFGANKGSALFCPLFFHLITWRYICPGQIDYPTKKSSQTTKILQSFANSEIQFKQQKMSYNSWQFSLLPYQLIRHLNKYHYSKTSMHYLTRPTWLIHTSVLPSNWNLGKNFALTV